MFLSWRQTSKARRTGRAAAGLSLEPLDERCVPSATPLLSVPGPADVDLPDVAQTAPSHAAAADSPVTLPALPTVSQADDSQVEVAPAQPDASDLALVDLRDQLFLPGRTAQETLDPWTPLPALGEDFSFRLIGDPFAVETEVPAAALEEAAPVVCPTEQVAAGEPVDHAVPCHAETASVAQPEGELLATQPESMDAAGEDDLVDVTAEEVLEEMLGAIAVDEMVGDVLLAYTEDEEGEEEHGIVTPSPGWSVSLRPRPRLV